MGEERAANALDKRFGERVRTRRLQIGMSQERLAELLGVTFQQVQKYEKGVNRIAASRLSDISVALDIPAAHFFEGIGKGGGSKGASEKASPSLDAALNLPDAVELLLTFAEIEDRNMRRRVLDLVKAMKNE